jgi:CDP-6-deoxy-D-xylo-4-hexulose-3-dehydrase
MCDLLPAGSIFPHPDQPNTKSLLVVKADNASLECLSLFHDEGPGRIAVRTEASAVLYLAPAESQSLSPTTSVEPTDALASSALAEVLKAVTLHWTHRFSHARHGQQTHWTDSDEVSFIPGQSTVPYAGRVHGADEVSAAVATTLDFWLTLGSEGEQLEKGLAEFLDIRYSLLVNSGSSANLLALSALTSPRLSEKQRLKPGDEVITCAAGFPTTVAPLLQNGLVPVFIDNDPGTLNPKVEDLEAAFSEGKTKAVIFAHAMGNPFDVSTVLPFCQKHDLWLIEDNCDSLGSRYAFTDVNDRRQDRLTGTFGDLSTQSFYPPHHLTMGEGGAVNIVREARLKKLVESFRDWGRDCWCPSGKDNTCNNRFGWKLGELPEGYDHKYIYSHIGYNLKPLDVQAAIGNVQLGRLPEFVEARKANWLHLRRGLHDLSEFFEFCRPTHSTGWDPQMGHQWDAGTDARSDPSWFGFLMRVRPTAPFSRRDLATYLDERKIGHRALFGGNLLRQPAFVDLRKNRPDAFRVIGSLEGADAIMNEAIFVGTYPGLRPVMLDYVVEQMHAFCKAYL